MDFNASKITTSSVVDSLGKPVLFGALGAAAGHFAGKGKNLFLAAGIGFAGIATGQVKEAWFLPAIVGCAVVTPPAAATVAGIDGLDSLKSFVTDGTSRAKGYAGSFLGNMGLSSIAGKVGLQGMDDEMDYDQGYMNGLNDYALLNDGSEVSGLNGYSYGEAGTTPKSLEAALAMQSGGASMMPAPMMGIAG